MNVEEALQLKFRVENINPQYMNNDHTHYQRFRIETLVQEVLAKDEQTIHDELSASPKHMGIVGLRSDGTYWVINGQHHIEAEIRLGTPSLEYHVFDSLGWEHEKEIFDKFAIWQQTEHEKEIFDKFTISQQDKKDKPNH
jgi:hypothetical protein